LTYFATARFQDRDAVGVVGAFCSIRFCRFQLGPKLRWNRRLHGAHIGKDLGLGMRADDQSHGNVWRRRELKRSGSQIGAATARSLSRFSMYWRGIFQDVSP